MPLPLVTDEARFTDTFNSLDIRISRPFAAGPRVRIEPMIEVFNVFNVTNILGVSNVNYSGFSNVLVRDAGQPGTPGTCARAGSASRSQRREGCLDPEGRGRCSWRRG